MSVTPLSSPSRGSQILKIILYILAGVVLVLGLVAGISLVSSAGSVSANLVLPLQIVGGEVAANLIGPVLSGFLVNLGIAALLLSFAISALLYAAGRLVGRIAGLEARLARLEARG